MKSILRYGKAENVVPAVGALALLTVSFAAPCAAQNVSTNFAATLRWHSHIDTDLEFLEFFQHDHTVAARFMLQHPKAYEGPILTVKGTGIYSIGQADYRTNNTWAAKLVVRIGPNKAYYTLPIPAGTALAGKWMHLAVVRRNNYSGWSLSNVSFTMYLNGIHREKDGGGDLTIETAQIVSFPEGVLRMGTDNVDPKTSLSQFYGFIDDVAIFNRRLSASEIQSLAAASRLSGTESGLLAGYSFDDADPTGLPLLANMARPFVLGGACYRTKVSPTRSNTADAPRLPLPYQPVKLDLPFNYGAVLEVVQGWEGSKSHNGYAAFAIDFVKAGGLTGFDGIEVPYSLPNTDSAGMAIFSACGGTVTSIRDTGDLDPNDSDGDTKDYYNKVGVEVAPGLHVGYSHVHTGSAHQALAGFGTVPFHIDSTQIGNIGNALKPKEGIVGDNWHLHFGAGNNGNGSTNVTVPLAFSEYEYWDKPNYKWVHVAKGVPRAGQFVRVPVPFIFDTQRVLPGH
jgi:hypothetical protein